MSHVMVMHLADEQYLSEFGNEKRACELVSGTLVALVLR